MAASLPVRPHLDHLRKQTKDLLRRQRAGERRACAVLRAHLPQLALLDDWSILRRHVWCDHYRRHVRGLREALPRDVP